MLFGKGRAALQLRRKIARHFVLITHNRDARNSNGFTNRRVDRHTYITLVTLCLLFIAIYDYYYFLANPSGALGALVSIIFTGHDATHFPSWRDAIFLETEQNSLASFGIQKTQFESPKKIG